LRIVYLHEISHLEIDISGPTDETELYADRAAFEKYREIGKGSDIALQEFIYMRHNTAFVLNLIDVFTDEYTAADFGYHTAMALQADLEGKQALPIDEVKALYADTAQYLKDYIEYTGQEGMPPLPQVGAFLLMMLNDTAFQRDHPISEQMRELAQLEISGIEHVMGINYTLKNKPTSPRNAPKIDI